MQLLTDMSQRTNPSTVTYSPSLMPTTYLKRPTTLLPPVDRLLSPLTRTAQPTSQCPCNANACSATPQSGSFIQVGYCPYLEGLFYYHKSASSLARRELYFPMLLVLNPRLGQYSRQKARERGEGQVDRRLTYLNWRTRLSKVADQVIRLLRR